MAHVQPRGSRPGDAGKTLKIVRKADAVDIERHGFNGERENEAFRICNEKIARYKLPMKHTGRVPFDPSKAIFYFTSDTGLISETSKSRRRFSYPHRDAR